MCVTLITYTNEAWPCFGALVGEAPRCSGKCQQKVSVLWRDRSWNLRGRIRRSTLSSTFLDGKELRFALKWQTVVCIEETQKFPDRDAGSTNTSNAIILGAVWEDAENKCTILAVIVCSNPLCCFPDCTSWKSLFDHYFKAKLSKQTGEQILINTSLRKRTVWKVKVVDDEAYSIVRNTAAHVVARHRWT